MTSAWNTSKLSGIPLHKGLPHSDELPWTISYVIRKRGQIDSFNELPEEQRPTEDIIWYGTSLDVKRWFDKVFKRKQNNPNQFILNISDDEIE